MSVTSPAEFKRITRYAFGCECGQRDCRRKLRLTDAEFDRRAAQGPVLADVCRVVNAMTKGRR